MELSLVIILLVNYMLIPKQNLTLSSQILKPTALNSLGEQGWETFG